MQTIEPFSLERHVEHLLQQLQRRQLASHQTAVEIALHIRGTPLADIFHGVTDAIAILDFTQAETALRDFATHL